MDKTRVENIDCMIRMLETPDKFYDLAIVDPPYGIGEDGHCRTRLKHNNKVKHIKKNWDDSQPTPEYWGLLFSKSKNQIIWGANYFANFLPVSMGWIFWDKRIGGDFSDGELAFTSFDRALKSYTYWNGNNGIARIHPTQKPVALYKWLLKNYAKEGDKILDTHGGSMSSVIACLEMGFQITCYEKDVDYYNLAKLRINNHLNQLNAFRPKYEIEFHDANGVSQLRNQP